MNSIYLILLNLFPYYLSRMILDRVKPGPVVTFIKYLTGVASLIFLLKMLI